MKKGQPTTYDFYLNIIKLEVVSTFKYLGVYFYKPGNKLRIQKHIANHASFALHNLFSALNNVEIPTTKKCNMFDALVSSILNYGCEVWAYHEVKDIEMVHTKFCRKILCVRQSTNVSGLFGELGRVPFSVLR